MTQFIPLTVYLETNIIVGIVALPDGVRLSDFLNTSEMFLKFTEASTRDGMVEQMNEIYINKEAIKFVKTSADNDGRGLGEKYYLRIKKFPVRTEMFMTDYELTGNLYCKNAADISNLFEGESPFLPCTKVKMRHVNSSLTLDAGFAAINRKKLYKIQTEKASIAVA